VLSGLALPYGVPGNTSAGRVTVDAGAVRVPEDLRRVKLFSEHGRQTPVGYTTTADDTPQALRLAFRVAATPNGDTALLEAAEGVRDALSVELDNVIIRGGHITADAPADLVGCVLTSIPAYADARLAAADTPTEGTAMPAVAGQFTGSIDGQLADPDPAAPPAAGAAASEPPAVRAAAPAPMLAARPAPTLEAVAARAGDAIARGDAVALNAALSDIRWSDGPGAVSAPPQVLGYLWDGVGYTRTIVPRTSYDANLSSMTVGGFVWEPPPVVADYAGDKAAVPSNAAKGVFKAFPAKRLAGAHDVDRAYEDLAVPGFWDAYWRAMAESYAQQSDTYVLNQILANGTDGGDKPDPWSAIVSGLVAVAAYGGDAQVALSGNLIEGIAQTPASDVPFLLSSMFGDLASLIRIAPPGIAPDTVAVWLRQAVTTSEAGTVPIRVQAVNLPNGGIDAALFGYIASFVTKPAAAISYTIVPPVTP
jgi:hypothetical protein